VALIPLTLWVLASLMALAGSDHSNFILWFQSPITTILMILLLIALFVHMSLGLQVVIEDYIHADWAKIPTLVMVQLMCIALAIAGIFATLRLALAG
jgi:succinate dehydrogenase / fumarate reductase membrane anchor subunit